MHRWILGASFATALLPMSWAAATGATQPKPDCPGPGAPVIERFTSADCSDCWAATADATPAKAWLFDWITPTPAGADAPMSAAAPLEARERALRSGGHSPQAQQMRVHRASLPINPSLRLEVQSGPAWNGYLALQLKVQGHLPGAASAWMALVERLPAGTDGSAAARELVRAVAGPLSLQALRRGRPLTHLSALRWPESAHPGRIQARAWIEATDGSVLAVAADGCALRG